MVADIVFAKHDPDLVHDPADRPVIFVGQVANLQGLDYERVKNKLAPRVTEEVSVG